jgi:ATPase subunit of ABC transporter with duplicated ATPase domains
MRIKRSFVARFSANASKAKQATSRARRLEKIELAEVVPSSRQFPYITYKQHKKLHRQALELNHVAHGFEGKTLFKSGEILLEAGANVAVIGENGAGKTTFLKCLMNELTANEGVIKWSENASIGYCPQDTSADFAEDKTLFDWLSQWRMPNQDDLFVRSILGRLLFTSDEVNKSVKVCSGGEKNRLMFGKLMMQEINVLIMDEPTNHMDMEAIESLNKALAAFDGTLIFVSHDREFVSSLADHIIEIKDEKLHFFQGSFAEYADKS